MEIVSLITSPSGTFFYHLTTTLIFLGAFIITVSRDAGESPQTRRRQSAGLGLLVSLRLALFAAAALMAAGFLAAGLSAPLDRAVSLISLAVIGWLWAFPERTRVGDAAALLLGLLALAFAAGAALLWLRPLPGAPGADAAAWGFGIFAAVLAGLGSLLLAIRRPAEWGNGLIMLMMLLGGEVAGLLAAPAATSAAAVRLATLAAAPLILALTARLRAAPALPPAAPPKPNEKTTPRKKYNIEPGMMESFLTLASARDLNSLGDAVTRVVAYSMVADICFLIAPVSRHGEFIIHGGYNLIREQPIPGNSLDAQQLPLIAASLEKKVPLRLPASSTSVDLPQLARALGFARPGHLLVSPILDERKSLWGGIGLLSPHSNRAWSVNDQNYLSGIAKRIGAILQSQQNIAQPLSQPDPAGAPGETVDLAEENRQLKDEMALMREYLKKQAGYSEQLQQSRATIAALQAQIAAFEPAAPPAASPPPDWQALLDELQAENVRLKIEHKTLAEEHARTEAAGAALKEASLATAALLEDLRLENASLAADLAALRGSIQRPTNGSSPEVDAEQAARELKTSLKEIARLQKHVADADIRILELENLARAATKASRNWDALINLGEEMRQPMSSIIGYSDFLLSESVGLLGALQRKFLERVKVSTERMSILVENLIHIAAVESGKLKLTLGSVNLSAALDSAIASVSDQIREKNAILRVDLADSLPEIEGDREALRLILTHLLQNAVNITPINGEVSVSAHFATFEDLRDYVRIQITDSGPGIIPADLPRVFERHAAPRSEQIAGLGMSSIGLSVARNLVEAHGGRIWVDSPAGAGATFCLILPTHQENPASLVTHWRS
jgi:signal transduction histidine kinase